MAMPLWVKFCHDSISLAPHDIPFGCFLDTVPISLVRSPEIPTESGMNKQFILQIREHFQVRLASFLLSNQLCLPNLPLPQATLVMGGANTRTN